MNVYPTNFWTALKSKHVCKNLRGNIKQKILNVDAMLNG